MTTLFFIIVAFICIGAISIVTRSYSRLNSKSKIPYTDNGYLRDRQDLAESLSSNNSEPLSEKPKSNLRGVKNKRFRKK